MNRNYPIIDVHSHILPGIDDGSRTVEESLKLLEMAYEQGIRGMIATPHGTRHRRTTGLEIRTEELANKVRRNFPAFFLFPGEETFYHEELPRKLLEKEALTLAGSTYVLVEFDPGVPYEALFRGLRRIQGAGFDPVLAHVERYACLREEKRLDEVRSLGCRLQMNYGSIPGGMFSSEARWCRAMLKKKKIWLMGTDLHRTDFRPPKLGEALGWLDDHLEPSYVRKLLHDHAEMMIKYETKS